jgi:transposase-like protein
MAPQGYTDEQRLEIIKRICGLIIQSSVEEACKQVGIAESTFYAWVAADELLAEEYARARVAIAYKDEVGIEKLVIQTEQGQIDPAAARVAIDGRKWLAGKRNPKVYGDKLDMTSDGKELKGATIVVSNEKQKDLLEKI